MDIGHTPAARRDATTLLVDRMAALREASLKDPDRGDVSYATMVTVLGMVDVFTATLGQPELAAGPSGSVSVRWEHGTRSFFFEMTGPTEWTYVHRNQVGIDEGRGAAEPVFESLILYEAAVIGGV